MSSFHVLFETFKQICDYFNISDINDREKYLTRVGASSSSTTLIRVLGTPIHEEEMSENFCFIGCDIHSHPSLSEHILYRSSGLWNNKNERYNLPITQLPSENNIPSESQLNEESLNFPRHESSIRKFVVSIGVTMPQDNTNHRSANCKLIYLR